MLQPEIRLVPAVAPPNVNRFDVHVKDKDRTNGFNMKLDTLNCSPTFIRTLSIGILSASVFDLEHVEDSL